MNIPDEVIEWAHFRGESNNADYRFIAEWARKEAFREAAYDFEHVVTSDDGTAWFYKDAADSLRALAEGDTNA